MTLSAGMRAGRGVAAVGMFLVALAAPKVHAVNLLPGEEVATNGGPGRSEVFILCNVVIPFEIPDRFSRNGFSTGELEHRVVRLTSSGTLVFINRISNDTRVSLSGITKLATADFLGFSTDVDYDTVGPGTIGTTRARRSTSGSEVTFDFTAPILYVPGVDESRIIYIFTDATTFAPGGFTRLTVEGRTAQGETVVGSVAVPTVMPVQDENRSCRDIDFEDRPTGAQFPVGSGFRSNGILMRVKEFYRGPGCHVPSLSGHVADRMTARAASRKYGQSGWLMNWLPSRDAITSTPIFRLSLGAMKLSFSSSRLTA